MPFYSRQNVAILAMWLWHLDLEVTYEQDEAKPRQTYLLDDLCAALQGGVFTVAYPTDYGKSTLIDMSVVMSLVLWPQDTKNTIVKATDDAAAASLKAVYWKLHMASQALPYAAPVCRGFFVAGSLLREFGSRDPSVYGAGIADSSLPGRRGRAHFDDLETENTVKSEAKMDTLRKQFNSCVRLIERHDRFLFLVAGTPQGANSVLFWVNDTLQEVLGEDQDPG